MSFLCKTQSTSGCSDGEIKRFKMDPQLLRKDIRGGFHGGKRSSDAQERLASF